MSHFDISVHAIAALCIWLTFDQFYKEPLSIFRFTAFCYSTVLLGGVSVILLGDSAFGYKMPLDGINKVFMHSLAGLIIMQGTHLLAKRLLSSVDVRPSTGNVPASTRWGLGALLALSVFSLLLFAASNGLSLGQQDYEYRYEAARGWGPIIAFFPAFLPFVFYKIYNSKGIPSFLLVSTISLAIGLTTYIVMSGYRQILIGTLIIICCVAMERRYIKRWHFVPGVAAFMLLIVSLSFMRYAGDSSGASTFESIGIAAYYYIQGDVFPMDAPLKIRDYCDYITPPGTDVVINHLAKIVPRALWEDKPLILLDAAGFYTQEVVGYARGVTLSPTVLGEGYLVGGSAGFYVLMFAGAITLTVLDVARKLSDACFFIIGSFIYGGFFFIREGFSELLLRALYAAVFMAIYYCLKTIFSGLPKR
jgi:WzyE protein.